MRSLKDTRSDQDLKNDSSPLAKRSDEALLHLIQTKDFAAYEELFSRYIPRAYALAKNLTGHKELAEEAAQEALLAVWNSASSFVQVRGKAKSWIFRIIANKAVQIIRKEQQDRAREKERAVFLPEDSVASGNLLPDLEKHELKKFLRGLVKNLSHENRHLVALYYGAGFSQDKIAEITCLPQRKISDQLKNIHELLKSGLRKGGYTMPATLGPIIFENLWTGWPIQKASAKFMLNKIGLQTHSNSVAAKTTTRMSMRIFAAVCLFSILTLAAVTFPYQPSTSQTMIRSESATAKEELTVLPTSINKRWKKTWDFNAPDSTDGLVFMKEKPLYVPKGKKYKSGCLFFKAGTHGITLLKKNLPLKITYQMKPVFTGNNQMFSSSLTWPQSQCLNVSAVFNNISSEARVKGTQWITYCIYVQEQVIDSWNNSTSTTNLERRMVIMLHLRPEVSFNIRGSGELDYTFDNLTIEEVAFEDLPDVSAFVSSYENHKDKFAPGKAHPIPELKRFQSMRTPIQLTMLNNKNKPKELLWVQGKGIVKKDH